MNAGAKESSESVTARRGLLFGLAAYSVWGVLPIYFKAIESIAAIDIVAHRIVWSLPFLAALLSIGGGWNSVGRAVGSGRTLRMLSLTALLVGINWLLYVHAITSSQILAASLGYYLNPLANVVLGRFVLKERLSMLQWMSVALAAAGIAVLVAGALDGLWISLTLCATFAVYGLIRKIAPVEALAGLTIETALLFPLAMVWLAWAAAAGSPLLGGGGAESWLLVFAGIVSTTPLLLFTAAARKLRYSTLGMLQFLAPTLQFLIAVWLYNEPFTTTHAIAFGAIWAALAIYVLALLYQARASVTLPE